MKALLSVVLATFLVFSIWPQNSGTGAVLPIEMVRVPEGSFNLFEPGGPTPRMRQTVSTFLMGRFEVTRAQFRAVMGWVPPIRGGDTVGSGAVAAAHSLPVDSVSWYEAISFCNRLSLMEGLQPVYAIRGLTDPVDWGPLPESADDPGWIFVAVDWSADGYRLPTDMEWRFAAREGREIDQRKAAKEPDRYAWYAGNAKDVGDASADFGPHAVGTREPNSLGIYDLAGNVWEWCHDWGQSSGYRLGDETDYRGPEIGRHRAIRGGSWFLEARWFDSNNVYVPSGRVHDVGFRLVRGTAAIPGVARAPGSPSEASPGPYSGELAALMEGGWLCEWNNGDSYVWYDFAADGTTWEVHRNLSPGVSPTRMELTGEWTIEGDIVTKNTARIRSNVDGRDIPPDAPWQGGRGGYAGTLVFIDGRLYWGDMAGIRQGEGTGYQGTYLSFTAGYGYDRWAWTKYLMVVNDTDIRVEFYSAMSFHGPWQAKPDRVVTARFTPPVDGYIQVLESSDPGFIYLGNLPVAWNGRSIAFRRPAYVRSPAPRDWGPEKVAARTGIDRLRQARKALDQGEYSLAIQLAAPVAAGTRSEAASRIIARARWEMDDFQEARKAYREYTDQGGRDPQELALYADALYELGEYREARIWLEAALAGGPDDGQLWWMYYRMADLLGRTGGTPEERIRVASEAIRRRPDEVVGAYGIRADAALQLGDIEGARSDLKVQEQLFRKVGDTAQADMIQRRLKDLPPPGVPGRGEALREAVGKARPRYVWGPRSKPAEWGDGGKSLTQQGSGFSVTFAGSEDLRNVIC